MARSLKRTRKLSRKALDLKFPSQSFESLLTFEGNRIDLPGSIRGPKFKPALLFLLQTNNELTEPVPMEDLT